MTSNTQLVNLWVESTNLNSGCNEKRHITVPVANPINCNKNVLTLLTLSLLPEFKYGSKPKINPNTNNIKPDIYLQDDLHLGLDKLWVFTRELSQQELKKAQHKCKKIICIGVSNNSELNHNFDLQFNSQLIVELSEFVHKKIQWNIMLDEQSITLSDGEHYLVGDCFVSDRFKQLNEHKQWLGLSA